MLFLYRRMLEDRVFLDYVEIRLDVDLDIRLILLLSSDIVWKIVRSECER